VLHYATINGHETVEIERYPLLQAQGGGTTLLEGGINVIAEDNNR
jgi:hypothetical protein